MLTLKDFLAKEVKPALGCTDPGAVALAVARACKELPAREEVASVRVTVSGSIYKNGMAVGIPGTRGARGNAMAAAMGARIFEKHFTIDRFYDCPDKDISCTPGEFAGIIESVENAVAMAGTGAIGYGSEEAGTARGARRSLFARRFIAAGKTIVEDDIVALRPGVGIPVYELPRVVGAQSSVDIPAEHLIRRENLLGL